MNVETDHTQHGDRQGADTRWIEVCWYQASPTPAQQPKSTTRYLRYKLIDELESLGFGTL